MRTRRPNPDHQAAVSRRLAQLGAELSASRLPPPEDAGAASSSPGLPDWWSGHTRLAAPPGPRPSRLSAEVPGAVPGEVVPDAIPDDLPGDAPRVPVPGRHAARRRGRLAVAVPEPLQGRVALGSGALAVVAVLVALGLAVTCWWVVRSDPGEPVGRLAAATAGESLATSAAGTTESTGPRTASTGVGGAVGGAAGADATSTVTVDVAGKVRRPGIAVLPAGSRVVDALEAAGGARRGVDLAALNLARVLLDGEQVLVGAEPVAVPGRPPDGGAAGAPGTAGPLVNINLAAQPELELLPDVGPVTAQSIIAWREEHGGFTAIEELLEVDGIGEATLAKLTPHVTV